MAIFPIMLIIVHTAFLSLGSNLGDKLSNLEQALEHLSASDRINIQKQSSWLANPAVEEAGPNEFLNGVIKITTDITPEELLREIQSIELKIDKERATRGRKYARMIDIDILIYDDLKINSEELTIPHPRMFERDFVTIPLNEIEAAWEQKYAI